MIIIFQTFLYLILLFLIKLIIERYGEWRQQRRLTAVGRKLNKIETLLKCHKIITNEDDCVICLEELHYAIELKCGHMFHRHCMDQLIEYRFTICPLCRAEIV